MIETSQVEWCKCCSLEGESLRRFYVLAGEPQMVCVLYCNDCGNPTRVRNMYDVERCDAIRIVDKNGLIHLVAPLDGVDLKYSVTLCGTMIKNTNTEGKELCKMCLRVAAISIVEAHS